MADVADLAQEREERGHAADIERSKANAANMLGERICRKCGELNDRYELGYAVCSDCVPGAA